MDAVEKLEKKVDRMPAVIAEGMKPVLTAAIQGLELRLQKTYGERMTKFEVLQGESKDRISGLDLKFDSLETATQSNSENFAVMQAMCGRNHKDSVHPPRTKTNPKIPQNVVKVGVPVTAITALITWLISKFG